MSVRYSKPMSRALGTILTAIVTPFDAEGKVNEESFVALMAPPRRERLGRVRRGRHDRRGLDADRRGAARADRAGRAERPAGKTIIAGTGTNDTRHAVHLTERATELGADAMLSVTPYYNRPSPPRSQAPLRSDREGDRQTDPALQHPGRTGTNMPPDLLAELAQIDGIAGVKQSNPASCS